MNGIVRNSAAELLSTFLFVLTIIAAVNNAGVLTPLVIGMMLMVLVYTSGHLSGGHLNPAVSLGVFIRGGMSVKEMFAYWLAQCIGAALAALLSATLFPTGEAVHIAVGPAFLAETVFTFILVTVVLNTATSQDNAGNSFYGLAIGATVFAGAATVGSISGGGFNPAVALGLSVSGQFGWSNLWLYILAPLIGGALAGLVFRIFNAHDLVIDPE